MDPARFDALARAVGRRGLIGAALALAGLGIRADSAEAGVNGLAGTCSLTTAGGRCKRNSQCCSGNCKLRKRKKKKNGKKRKKRGRCQCSPLRAPCASTSDCCPPPPELLNAILPVCDFDSGLQKRICCMPPSAHCSSDADCCGIGTCLNTGKCFIP